MATWLLVPCLGQLRTELNVIAPNRDKSSDGSIGDTAHQSRISDHNDDEIGKVPIKDADKKHEVHAVDLDVDLREPNLTMEMVVQHTLSRCRSGAEKRLRYIIYNRRIWEQGNGWRQRTYAGDNPHMQHAHFSSSYETKLEASTASWHLEDIPVALTEADKKWLSAQIDKAATAAAERVWKTKFDIDYTSGTYIAEAGSILAHIPSEHTRQENLLESIKEAMTK
jgi:hypothetical protein